ncbi:hypothetical protein IWQ60_003043 [Tieghemiomyces parasiticus]|uniref:BED-type domain-containing protein n=1 Tax=Tieghemiomyces parasiticus TaxID=78921 RepID=A0A9W8AB09_9FUNG|nr:hypothetical protein IWQ60_003043 [Tieghemiomyces parasiticus]
MSCTAVDLSQNLINLPTASSHSAIPYEMLGNPAPDVAGKLPEPSPSGCTYWGLLVRAGTYPKLAIETPPREETLGKVNALQQAIETRAEMVQTRELVLRYMYQEIEALEQECELHLGRFVTMDTLYSTPKRPRLDGGNHYGDGEADLLTPSPSNIMHPATPADRVRGQAANGSVLSPATLVKREVKQKVLDGIYSLRPPPGTHHSACWEKFSYVADEHGQLMPFTCCKTCKDVYTYKGKDTGTKGMIHHRCKRVQATDASAAAAMGVTPSMVDHLLNGKNKFTDVSSRAAKEVAATPAVTAALAGELLAQALNKDQTTAYAPVNQEIRQVLLQSCITFICQDMRAVDTFADEDFLDLLQTAINLGSKFGNFDVTRILLPNADGATTVAPAPTEHTASNCKVEGLE